MCRLIVCSAVAMTMGAAWALQPPLSALAERRLMMERQALSQAAETEWEAGKQAEALVKLRRVLEIDKAVMGDDHPVTERTALWLAYRHRIRGEWAKDAEYMGVAERVCRKRLGPDHWRAVECRSSLVEALANARRTPRQHRAIEQAAGVSHQAMDAMKKGHWPLAVALQRRALGLIRLGAGERGILCLGYLFNLARFCEDMGDRDAALGFFEEALVVTRIHKGEKHPEYAEALAELVTRRGGDEGLLKRARALLLATERDRGDEEAPLAQRALAVLHTMSGDYAAALPHFVKAVESMHKAVGRRHPAYAGALSNLADGYVKVGRLEEALRASQRSWDVYKEQGEEHPNYAGGLATLAHLYLLMDRPGAALPLSERSLALTRRAQGRFARRQSEREQLAAAARFRFSLQVRLSLPDDGAHASHGHVLAWKGAVFAAQQAQRALLSSASPATRRLASDLRETTGRLAVLASHNDEGSQRKAMALSRRKEELEALLSQEVAGGRAPAPPSSEQLRAALPRGVVLVDFLIPGGFDAGRPVRGQKAGWRLLAWVVRRDAAPVRLDLGLATPVEQDVAAWRKAIEAGEDEGEAPARLRERVWQPVEKHLGGASIVLVSPDGALGLLPFSALPGKEKGKRLLEEVPLAVLPVPRVLPSLLEPAAGKRTLLTLAGADFGAGKGPWLPLPAAAPEAEAVAALFRASGGEPFSALAGGKATRAALAAALEKHRHAHLATHGFFASSPGASIFAPGAAVAHPGLLSGLVLAGANAPTAEDNGVLTALEIAGLDLSNLDLAVLSACQTGLGQGAAGEGMLGLQRAFAVAGCKSAVSSLWSVHDAATAVLMERFYLHLWEKKLSKVEALRQAQLDVLRSPEWVERHVALLAKRGLSGLRGVGKVAEKVGKVERRSPVAWWGAWQLSGDWR